VAIKDEDVLTIEQFAGLRNTVRPEYFAPGDLEVAKNADINDALKLSRRKGTSTLAFAGAYHSLFADGDVMLGVAGGTMRRLFAGGTTAVLRAGLTDARVSYAPMASRIYYTNGILNGCVDAGVARTWGIDPPPYQPVATAIGGGLPAGVYQYAVTYVRVDGQESGTGASGQITLTTDGGIQFTAIPVPSDAAITQKRLYISPVNGDSLHRVQTLDGSATSATYSFEITGGAPLTTQFKQSPIAGQIAVPFNGRILIARGRRLYCTDAYAPELLDLRRNFVMGGHITLVAPVEDGVYLGTEDEVIFLAGDDPSKWLYKRLLAYGAIGGTVAYGDAEDVLPDAAGTVAIFGTKQGIVAAFNGGAVKNLTKDRFQYPVTERGAGIVRAHGGMIQYLMVLEGTTTAGNTAFE
jgi:hypothetical protein